MQHFQMFGLPGAGKTFIAKQLSLHDDFTLLKPNRKFEKIFYSLLFVLIHPIFCWRILKTLFNENKNKELLLHKLKLFLKAAALQFKAPFFRKVIVDDGLCQFLITIYDRKINNSDLSIIKKLIPKHATIFIVEAPDEKRLVRMRERGRVPRSFMGNDYLDEIIPVWEFNAEVLKSFLINNFKVEIIEN